MKVEIKISKAVITITIQFLKDFFSFLSKKGALVNFVEAVEKNRGSERFVTLAEKRNPEDWVSGAFIWSETPQGSEYWSDLHEEWKQKLGDLKKEAVKDIDMQEGTEVRVIVKPEGDVWV